MKGLPTEGKERLDDAVRWEQWEARGGLKKINAKPPVKQLSTPAISKVGPSIQHGKSDAYPNIIPLPAKPSIDSNTPAPPTSTDSAFPTLPVMCK